jgi:hypothetical protein
MGEYLTKQQDDPRTAEYSREVFAKGLSYTVDQITAAGIKVILMGQVPEFKANANRCWILSRYLLFNEMSCLSRRRVEVERHQAFANDTLRSIAARNPNVAVFWPIPHMCDALNCFASRGDKVLYWDGHHLSPEGALFLAGAFQRDLPGDFLMNSNTARPLAGPAAEKEDPDRG